MSFGIPQPPHNAYDTNSVQDGLVEPTEVTRAWAYEFYLRNKRFVRSLVTEHDLCYFYNIWAQSDGVSKTTVSMECPNQTSPPFQEVIGVFTEHFKGNKPVVTINTSGGRRKLSWINDKTKIHFTAHRAFFPTRYTYRGDPDRADRTERVARNWAKRFYMENIGFVRNAIHNRKALAYFYKIWSHSSFATLSGFFADEDRFYYRPFSQILFALVNDGRVCRVLKSRDIKVSPIIWMKNLTPNNPLQRAHYEHQSFNSKMISRVEFARKIQVAVTAALSKVLEGPVSPPYAPITPPRKATVLGSEPPPIRRISRQSSVYSDEENDTCGADLIMSNYDNNE